MGIPNINQDENGEAFEQDLSVVLRRMAELETAFRQATDRIAAIETAAARAAQTEQKFAEYRTCRSLARVSRFHPKSRTVIFVGINYFGDNIKYAFLSFLDYARANNIAEACGA